MHDYLIKAVRQFQLVLDQVGDDWLSQWHVSAKYMMLSTSMQQHCMLVFCREYVNNSYVSSDTRATPSAVQQVATPTQCNEDY